ncbi:MAG: NgoFVII family restriction endonuclease, partial [Chitinophagaceae bacterium]|nr:NgoFVII family restriction endonuclease [Chitinophagaceae bacterium]
MHVSKQKNGVSIIAHKGDAMSLLSFDLTAPLRENLAGFTIFFSVKGKGRGSYVFNRMIFPDNFLKNNPQIPVKERNSTLYSPLQKMNWVHVPNTDIETKKAVFGDYTYSITPRYIENGKLLPLDKSLTVKLTINVSPFNINKVKVAFARGFVSSVAYANRFGDKNNKVRPPKKKDELLFNINQVSGSAERWNDKTKKKELVEYTYAEQHDWLGWQARKTILGFLDDAIKNPKITLKVFAYDLDEPEICRRLLTLAAAGRLKIILDNSGKHGLKTSKETAFEKKFNTSGASKKDLARGKFSALAHSKVFIWLNNGKAQKVLTGSTNFSTNGIYINANHVLVFDNSKVAKLYEEVFEASFGKKKMAAFKKTPFTSTDHTFSNPAMTITFAPHNKADADRIFKRISDRINATGSDLLFAIMNDTSNSLILDAVKKQVKSGSVFTYGITDTIGKANKDYTVYLYRPDTQKEQGIRVAAKGINNILPPPLGKVPGLSG